MAAAGALPPDAAAAAACGDMLDRCLQLVVQHKLQKQVESLASLGFPPSAALAAVQQHGGNLEAAVAALLEQATGMSDSLHGLGSAGGQLPEVDLSEELAFMQVGDGVGEGRCGAVVLWCCVARQVGRRAGNLLQAWLLYLPRLAAIAVCRAAPGGAAAVL